VALVVDTENGAAEDTVASAAQADRPPAAAGEDGDSTSLDGEG
jgi:hypothetical protein